MKRVPQGDRFGEMPHSDLNGTGLDWGQEGIKTGQTHTWWKSWDWIGHVLWWSQTSSSLNLISFILYFWIKKVGCCTQLNKEAGLANPGSISLWENSLRLQSSGRLKLQLTFSTHAVNIHRGIMGRLCHIPTLMGRRLCHPLGSKTISFALSIP